MNQKQKLMIVDDDIDVREMLIEYFESQDFDCLAYPSAIEAFEDISTGKVPLKEIGVILSDISMPKMDGLEFLQRLQRYCPEIPVVLMTAHSSIETAIEATRNNAFDYLVKPFKLNDVQVCLRRALRYSQVKRENSSLRDQIKGSWSRGNIIGKSKAIQSVFDLIDRVSQAKANVLINGESGTGKELVAQSIHHQGQRKDAPFVAINCTSIPENLLESELFGHVKGSFTGAVSDKKGLFEEAHGGTLFLDEIGDLDLSLQAKLLRVLQEKQIKAVGSNQFKNVDVRVIAATHKDLRKATREGNFREDLYFRLSVIPITIPPLRERIEDIPLLADFFLEKYSAANGNGPQSFSKEAMAKLVQFRWPGNVRELENVVERLVVLCPNAIIGPKDISLDSAESGDDFLGQALADWPTLEQLEKRYIQLVLEKTAHRKERAAQILGINRRTLYRKEQDWSSNDS